MQVFDQFTVDDDDAFAFRRRFGVDDDDLFRPFDLFGGRRKGLIGGVDGLRVNQGLAVEAQFRPLAAGIGEPFVVVEVQVDPVENGDPGRPGGQHAQPQRGDERQPVAGVGALQVLGQIRRTHDQRADAGAGFGNFLGVQHAEWCFHHAPDRQGIGRPGRIQDRFRLVHGAGTFHLGQKNRIGTHGGGGGKIIVAPGRIHGVDADDQFALAIAAFLDGVPDLVPRHFLGVGGDRVLQVQDQPVGGKGASLFQCPGVGPRHVKDGAARTRGFQHSQSP